MTIVEEKARLRNDGELELFFLGVGTAFSGPLGHTNFLITKGDDHLLVDFGTTGPERLSTIAGIEANRIRAFLPTHAHADHVGGMEYLTICNRYWPTGSEPNPPLTVVATEEFSRALWRMTLRGGLGFNEPGMDGRDELFEAYYDVIRPAPLPGVSRQTWRTKVGGIELEMFLTTHVLGEKSQDGMPFLTHGVLIDNRIFFSGDSRFDPELIGEYSKRAKFWIHEASLTSTPLHTSLEELRGLPREITERMMLVHYPEGAEEMPLPGFFGWGRPGVRYLFE